MWRTVPSRSRRCSNDAHQGATSLGDDGSGNGARLNPVLRASLEQEFGMPTQLGPHTEEAAVGAALCAAVADGAFPSIAAASAAFVGHQHAAKRSE